MKLLGDEAMLRLADATVGVEAALELVEGLSVERALSPHAGINAGPLIERDLDVLGQTVNLASRSQTSPLRVNPRQRSGRRGGR